MVSSVASAPPRLPASDDALAYWFFLRSCAARLAARCVLRLPEGGRIFAFALVARTSSRPLFQRSSLALTSVLTAEEEAPGFHGPNTRVGNKKSASHVASRNISQWVSTALLRRSVTTGNSAAMQGLGIATAD